MSGISGDFKALGDLCHKLETAGSSSMRLKLMKVLGEEYRDFMMDCFRSGHSPYGDKWATVKLRVSANGAAQKPLLDTGIMRGAVTPRNYTDSGFHVVVGRKYASTHQFGAVIVPKRAKALRFRGVTYHQTTSKSGKTSVRRKYGNWIFARRVEIPARPYAPLNGMPPKLDSLLDDAASDFIEAYFK